MPFDVEESDYYSVFKRKKEAQDTEEEQAHEGKGKGKGRERVEEPISVLKEELDEMTAAQQEEQQHASLNSPPSNKPSLSQSKEPTQHEKDMAQYDEWLKKRGIDMRDKHFECDPAPPRKRWQTDQMGPRKMRKLGVGLPPPSRKTAEQLVEEKEEAEAEREWKKLERLLHGPHGYIYSQALDKMIESEYLLLMCRGELFLRKLPFQADRQPPSQADRESDPASDD